MLPVFRPVFWVEQSIDGWCVFKRYGDDALTLVGCYSARVLAEFVSRELAKRADAQQEDELLSSLVASRRR